MVYVTVKRGVSVTDLIGGEVRIGRALRGAHPLSLHTFDFRKLSSKLFS